MRNSTDKILITGATGFIGRHLCRQLIRKQFPIEVFEGDIRCFEDLKQHADISIIIHLAARVRGHYTKEEIEQVNVAGTENVLKFACQQKAKVIHASSYLYASAGDLPLSEDTATSYWNHYSYTKWKAEQKILQYHTESGLEALILRIFNAYGPEQQLGYLIPDLIDGLQKGCMHLRNTSPRRDFIHVDDIVDLILKGCKKQWSGFLPVNVGTGIGYSVMEALELIMELTGQRIPIESDDKPVAIGCAIANIETAKKVFDWKPRVTFRNGLKEMLEREGFKNATP